MRVSRREVGRTGADAVTGIGVGCESRRPPPGPGAAKGFGPARNLVAFTGGDLTCRPEYYAKAASAIRRR